MRFTRIGAISSARLATSAGSAAVPAAAILKTDSWAAGSGAAHKQQRSSRSHLAASVPSDLERHQEVHADFFACLRKIHIHEPPTVRPTRCDHYMVDRPRQVTEELLEGSGVGGIEGYVTQRAKFCRGALETLGIPTSENYLGSLGACNSGRFETDAGTAADHHDCLPGSCGSRTPWSFIVAALRRTALPACTRRTSQANSRRACQYAFRAHRARPPHGEARPPDHSPTRKSCSPPPDRAASS